ncbi:hypothetical protein [Bradyrhizobium sp. JYMT SZCCT0180]|uniref:hypothetical protein n=1 Tax=Bradyrhizobium sp. JYMT SZCCT0180 TaxID=2807666 RepID=UPI001BAE0450|nr:hypothetical protein [Bradyrhizobium sp. JYMT SZCCT0180]MBR1213385.1 hypothetical protein [Bradyrhizobium sp. JYMT SZCCT0180]
MRKLVLLSVIACLASGSAAADAPFVLHAAPPDYVVTMAWNSHGKTGQRTVTHHGNWTHVGGAGYFSGSGDESIMVFAAVGFASFERGRTERRYYDYEPRNTGERQTHLGESCTVWDVRRTKRERAGFELTHLSCVTDDGIELWWKDVNGTNEVSSSAEATSVVRRPVKPEDVRPSRKLLTVNWWDQTPPSLATQATPDHETVMELSDGSAKAEKSIRTTRRRGPWQYLEEKVDHFRRSLRITHDSRRIYVHYRHDEGRPHERLELVRYEPTPTESSTQTSTQANSMEPIDRGSSETVLGETCRWFDMMPGMMDAGHLACLTNDGIKLKERLFSRGSDRSWTAIRLTRRPIGIDEIKPPAELLDPQRWGIE